MPSAGDAQLFANVGPGMRVGGRGQREPGDIGKIIHQRAQQPVIGAEIMPPFGDAMRLVYREQGDPAPRAAARENRAVRGAFRRNIKQVELARAEPLDRLGPVIVCGCQRRRPDPAASALRIWSCINAINGEMTIVVPPISNEGS